MCFFAIDNSSYNATCLCLWKNSSHMWKNIPLYPKGICIWRNMNYIYGKNLCVCVCCATLIQSECGKQHNADSVCVECHLWQCHSIYFGIIMLKYMVCGLAAFKRQRANICCWNYNFFFPDIESRLLFIYMKYMCRDALRIGYKFHMSGAAAMRVRIICL